MRIVLFYSLDIVCFLPNTVANAENRVENKTDRVHTAVDLEDCAIGRIFSKSTGLVLRGTVSRSNDEVSPHGFMGSRHQQRCQAKQTLWTSCNGYWHKPRDLGSPLVFLRNIDDFVKG